ncbi:MAG: hypothetical protein GX600_01705 [Dehalococcoidia bacterium]|nr:hypothetical protein [Dehalococcoidia bacterium]
MPTLEIDGWAGRTSAPVEVVGETPKRYRVRLLQDTRLPGRYRRGAKGDVVLVPRYAVKGYEEAASCGK